jgi:hypothetical protein
MRKIEKAIHPFFLSHSKNLTRYGGGSEENFSLMIILKDVFFCVDNQVVK